MKTIAFAISAIALTASLGGCATVTRGTTTAFQVTSTPPGAAVKTSNGFSCDATPCSIKMPRKDAFDVTLTKTGYAAKTLHVRSAVAGGGAAGMAGNLLLGGIIGMAVDGTNGSMNDLTPNPMDVKLDAEVADAPAAPPADAPAPSAAPSPMASAATAPSTGPK